jgi:acyl-CoA synthetase
LCNHAKYFTLKVQECFYTIRKLVVKFALILLISLSEIFDITKKDVIYFGTPETFDPSVVEMFLALSNGATLCAIEESLKKDINSLANILFCKEKGGVTVLQTTPSLFKRWSMDIIQEVVFQPKTTLRILVFGKF